MAVPRNLYHEAFNNINEDDYVLLFTWNPKPRFYDKTTCYTTQWLTMLNVLKEINKCSYNYAIAAELSDSGKLHCHGFIVLQDKVKWLKSVRPRIQRGGFMKHGKANSHEWKVFKYHVKEVDVTYEMINKEVPIVLTPHSYKDVKDQLALVKMHALKQRIDDDKDKSRKLNKNILCMFNQENSDYLYDIDD